MSYKVSIVYAYFQRPAQFDFTLKSIAHHYIEYSNEIEIICIDDSSVGPLRAENVLKESGLNYKYEFVDRSDRKLRNPGPLYNMAVDMAESDFIMLTNPENFHCGPVVTEALEYKEDNRYIIFGCRPLRHVPTSFNMALKDADKMVIEEIMEGWYQHSVHYNRLLHFASFITKEDYKRIGGFDEDYDRDDILGYEDNDFVERVLSHGMDIVTIDNPYVAHQPHARSMNGKAVLGGKNLFRKKWGMNPRVFSRDLRSWREEA